MAVIVQGMNSHTASFAKGLPRQTALFKIPYQALNICPAQTPSPIAHAATSTRNYASEKGGFARRNTDHRNYISVGSMPCSFAFMDTGIADVCLLRNLRDSNARLWLCMGLMSLCENGTGRFPIAERIRVSLQPASGSCYSVIGILSARCAGTPIQVVFGRRVSPFISSERSSSLAPSSIFES